MNGSLSRCSELVTALTDRTSAPTCISLRRDGCSSFLFIDSEVPQRTLRSQGNTPRVGGERAVNPTGDSRH